jgi:hypothetical protein
MARSAPSAEREQHRRQQDAQAEHDAPEASRCAIADR